MPLAFALTSEEQSTLGSLAELSITSTLAGKNDITVPPLPDHLSSSILQEHLGSFVTLHLHSALRGCIGTITGREPLYQNVWRMAHAAAFEDPRFPPISSQEWKAVSMEISVLGPLTPCPSPDAIEIGRHGLLLVHGPHSGVFLPQVPVEQGWDTSQYLENLCRKAGLPPHSWQDSHASLYWYEAIVFPVK